MFDTKLFEECLARYKEAFRNRFLNEKEKYKWEAIKWFQDHWNINAESFYNMFTLATEKTYNLLASMNNFPRGVIQVFAEQEPESVRAMFINLYDESKDVAERILKFQLDAQELGDRLLPGKQHYQRPMAISVYLWLHDPEKYCIYKYTAFRNASVYLGNDYIPKKGNPIQNIRENQKFVEKICRIISNDRELVAWFREALDDECYDDQNLLTLANDLEIFISLEYVDGNGQWLAQNHSSGLNKEAWKTVLENDEIFDLKSQKILARMLDFGGQATCSQLAEKYGEDFSFYNFGSTAFAKKVAKETNCKLWIDEKGKENYRIDWCPFIKQTFNGFGNAIEYLGRYTHKIAISNGRLISVSGEKTSFWARGKKPGDPKRVVSLDNHEFIRRFLLHVLPPGFQKIRYYGFLNNRMRKKKLKLIFKLQGHQSFKRRYAGMSMSELLKAVWKVDVCLCPACGHSAMKQLGKTYLPATG